MILKKVNDEGQKMMISIAQGDRLGWLRNESQHYTLEVNINKPRNRSKLYYDNHKKTKKIIQIVEEESLG